MDTLLDSYLSGLNVNPTSESGHIAKAALMRGCCARCALRYAGLARKVLYQIPVQSVEAAVRRAVEYAGEPSEASGEFSVCEVCRGLLQGGAVVRFPREQSSPGERRHRAAAVSLGQQFGSDGKARGTKEESAALTPYERSDDWVWATACAVASSGYDLRGGVAISLMMGSVMLLADSEMYRSLRHAVRSEGFPSVREVMSVNLKAAMRSFLALALTHVLVESIPQGATLLHVAEFLRGVSANGSSSTSEKSSSSSSSAVAAPPTSTSSSSSEHGSSLRSSTYIDLGMGVFGSRRDTVFPEWDDEDANSPLVMAVEGAVRQGIPLGTDVSSGNRHIVADSSSQSGFSLTEGGEAAHLLPLQVTNQSSLILTCALDETDAGAAAPKPAGKPQRRSKKAKTDTAAAQPSLTSPVAGSSTAPFGEADAASSGDAVSSLPIVAPEEDSGAAVLPRLSCTLQRSPMFIKGRYNKFARGLSQAPWFVEGKR